MPSVTDRLPATGSERRLGGPPPGRRHTASIASLHGIARALDVDSADLLGKRNSLPTNSQDEGVEAIRRALAPVDDLIDGAVMDVEPLPLAEAKRTADYLWGAYWAG